MKHCQQCNQNFADDFNYCLSCGNPIKETVTVSRPAQSARERETFIQCPACRNFVQSDAWRCEYCGTALRNVEPPTSSRPEPPPTRYVSPQQWETPAELSQRSANNSAGLTSNVPPTRVAMPTSPVRTDPTTPSLSPFQPYGTAQAARRSLFRWWHALILVGFFFGLVGLLGVGGWWWWSDSSSTTNDNTNRSQTSTSTPSASPARSKPTVSDNSADVDLRRLQERISNANSSDTGIVVAIADGEKKYPSDYRFAYERAKLIGKRMIPHDDAWVALRRAAEIAIDNNKVEEISSDMKARAHADFWRLSSHAAEWNAIIQALESHDKAALKHVH